LFIKRANQQTIFILIYVDDIIIIGLDPHHIQSVINNILNIFPIKDLRDLHYFLGVEIKRTINRIHLNQSKYLVDVLKRFKLDGIKPYFNPMANSTKLSNNQSDYLSNLEIYQSLVGSLQYLCITWPNIAYIVNKVNQYQVAPTTDHMKAVKCIVRYLKSTPHHGLLYRRNCDTFQHLNAYSDVDWGGDIDDKRSHSGHYIFLGKNLISWQSRKQRIVARSSMEFE
jgi:histone deacetylase 1/2